MKTLYTFLAAAGLLLLTPATSQASRPCTDTPTETASKAPAREQRIAAKAAKAAAKATHKKNSSHHMRRLSSSLNRAFLVFLGMEDSKAVTSPAKLNRQLHAHQKHLKIKTKLEAKARRRRIGHMFR